MNTITVNNVSYVGGSVSVSYKINDIEEHYHHLLKNVLIVIYDGGYSKTDIYSFIKELELFVAKNR